MKGIRRALLLVAWLGLCALAATLVPGNAPRVAAVGSFLETFDGAPAMPEPWHSANWDVTVHSRDLATFNTLETMQAMHGTDCSAPPAMHAVSRYEDAVFQCKDHVMTAIKAGGYGVIYLTPNQLVDFSAGEAVVRFDMSTLRTSDRDWVDFWITPFNDNLQLVGDIGDVDLSGFPRNAIHIRQDQVNRIAIFRGGVVRSFNEQVIGMNDTLGLESLLTPSATDRTTFELRVSRTHLKFGIPALNAWWVDDSIGDLGWTSGVLQIGHHSYNPEKTDGCGPPVEASTCAANTWHWDNVGISPASPFTILQSDRRSANQSAPQLSFSAAAPANSRLRFSGVGRSVGVSYDGGATWQNAQMQASSQVLGEEHFQAYWMPIPAGTRQVRFRATNWYGGPWLVRDATIWASDAPLATPQPIVTAAPPPPPPSPSPAPSAGVTAPPTNIPTVAPTASPLPSAGPVATLPSPPPPSGPTTSNPAAAGYHSAWFDQSTFPRLAPGQVGVVTVRFRNSGTETWESDGPGRQVNLGVRGDSPAFADLGMDVGWLSADRPATATEHSVAPGQVGTFRFAVRAPATPGTYRIDLGLVVDGLSWLEDQGVYITVTSDYGLHSTWVSQTPWPQLRVGELSAPITLTFRNTGDRAWFKDGGEPVKLGVVGDDTSWGAAGLGWPAADRPAFQSESLVAPGASASFTFQIRAPSEAGVYVLPLRLVVDGLTWLDDQGVFVQITVEP